MDTLEQYAPKRETLDIRVGPEDRGLIDRAARVVGKNLQNAGALEIPFPGYNPTSLMRLPFCSCSSQRSRCSHSRSGSVSNNSR